jgi:hypothetical protein
MRESWAAYRRALWKHSKALVSGTAAGMLGIVLSIHPVAVPAWVWFLIAVASVGWLGFVVFHDVRLERDRTAYDLALQLAKPSARFSFVWIKGLLRLSLTNDGPGDIPGGKVVNLLLPDTWGLEECDGEGQRLLEPCWKRQPSDEPVMSDQRGEVDASLWYTRTSHPLDEGLTQSFFFRITAPIERDEERLSIRAVLVGYAASDFVTNVSRTTAQ